MRNPQNMWLLAAATTAGVGVAEVAVILHLIPGTTIIDTGALLVTGFLAGLFMKFHITHRQTTSTDQPGQSS